MQLVRRFLGSRPFQLAAGFVAAESLRMVWKTSRLIVDPPDLFEQLGADVPWILTTWHGQHFLGPFVKPKHVDATALVSRHHDAEINDIAIHRLGFSTVRGSGGLGRDVLYKGGTAAFRQMLRAMRDGCSVAMTADVPRVACRVAGLGVVSLARLSGRPIYPLAVATRYRFELDNFDRTTVPLPFGRCAVVGSRPICVPADADDAAMERARRTVEAVLNDATARAYRAVDERRGARRLEPVQTSLPRGQADDPCN